MLPKDLIWALLRPAPPTLRQAPIASANLDSALGPVIKDGELIMPSIETSAKDVNDAVGAETTGEPAEHELRWDETPFRSKKRYMAMPTPRPSEAEDEDEGQHDSEGCGESEYEADGEAEK